MSQLSFSLESTEMRPLITTKGKWTQLRYEIPNRVHDSKIYPVKAPNGSTIILYGHDSGVGIIWRGGRPLKKAARTSERRARAARINGIHSNALAIVDADNNKTAETTTQQYDPKADFESDEEELDPDEPYPNIIQHIHLPLNGNVLHLAMPYIPTVSPLRPEDTIPPIFSEKIVFSVACADSTICVITLPLYPPPDSSRQEISNNQSQHGEEIIEFHAHQAASRGLTMTWTARGQPNLKDEVEDEGENDEKEDPVASDHQRAHFNHDDGFDLVLASHAAEFGGVLKVWRFEVGDKSLSVSYPISPFETVLLHKPAARIAFSPVQYPKHRHLQLLLADFTGTARIYDLLASPSQQRSADDSRRLTGAFVGTFRSAFKSVKDNTYTPAILAARKSIIDAAWTTDGRHVIALLADGEWGVWDVDRLGPNSSADPSAFLVRGFAGHYEKEESSDASSPERSTRSSLVPMTPNTRRRKEKTLFQGCPASSVVAANGGISVTSSPGPNEALEESFILWYNSKVYKIPGLAKFWARAAVAGDGSSLPGPTLQLQDVSVLGECITSVSQFPASPQTSQLSRDLLVSAEHRLIITVSSNQSLRRDLSTMWEQEPIEEETRRTDQVLLSRGELDLGGMNRLMEDMEDSGVVSKRLTFGGPRKVLFASSAN